MSGRNLLILALVTLAVALGAYTASHFRAPQQSAEKPLLFPGLAAKANDVAEIRISGKGRGLTLKKQGESWVMVEADGYPARFQRVRETVVGAADLRVADEKTSNPELYDRLGVEDPAATGAGSILLSLLDAEGKSLAEVIVGRNQTNGEGLYVRKPDAQQALLVDGRLNLSVETRDWFERDLFDVRSDRVAEIVTDHGDGKPLRVARKGNGIELMLDGIPEGKEVRSEVMVTRIGTLLENFFVDGVRSESKVIFPQTPVTTTVRTSDGLVGVFEAAMVEDRPMVKMSFVYEAPATPPETAQGDESAAAAAATPEAGEAQDAEAAAEPAVEEEKEDVAAEAARLEKAVDGWVFEIPDFKYELFTRRMEDLIRDPAEEPPPPVAPEAPPLPQ